MGEHFGQNWSASVAQMYDSSKRESVSFFGPEFVSSMQKCLPVRLSLFWDFWEYPYWEDLDNNDSGNVDLPNLFHQWHCMTTRVIWFYNSDRHEW